MREPKFLSPTSVSLFYKNRDKFYLKYLADNRPPREKQTRPMSVGSAFDAYIKAYLEERLFGLDLFDELFTTQVEAHNRDWAKEAGKHVFDFYKSCGALKNLLKELEQAKEDPKFEATVTANIDGVPLLGKPDLYFITAEEGHVILDWKVNGYCSRSRVSPKPEYVCIRPSGKPHKNAHLIKIGGIMCNVNSYFETIDSHWCNQLCIYAWTLGEEVGGRFIIGIDQVVCKPGIERPDLRVALHRSRASSGYQKELMARITKAWETIQSGHIFDELSKEDSDARCSQLDIYHEAFDGEDDIFARLVRG